jgi:hypothetical protein
LTELKALVLACIDVLDQIRPAINLEDVSDCPIRSSSTEIPGALRFVSQNLAVEFDESIFEMRISYDVFGAPVEVFHFNKIVYFVCDFLQTSLGEFALLGVIENKL